jgi:uncharacterized protein YbjT (DUF2867 family)
MRVLVAGGEGFIGRYIVVALRAAGHEVVSGARRPVGGSSIPCDFSRDLDPGVWASRLQGFDVVVNAVGILRESGANTFERIHVSGPKALFEGCVLAGVRRVVHISALGSVEVGEYLASKYRGDAQLAELDLDWTILRPSLVYSASGSYGGTSLLRAMAALPGVVVVPSGGQQTVQPIRAEDLAAAVVGLVDKKVAVRETVLAVGPDQIRLLEYLKTVRRWLEVPDAVVVRIPAGISHLVAWIGERSSDGPLGLTMWRMLQVGNVAPPGWVQVMAELCGRMPLSVSEAFAEVPSFVQDRWHARLYFLGPTLRIALGLVWVASAAVGFLTPLAQDRALFAAAGISGGAAVPLVWLGSAVDLVLGVGALVGWRIQWVAALMLASLVVYTIFVGIAYPSAWIEPFGGLLKNLPLMPAVLIMGILAGRR